MFRLIFKKMARNRWTVLCLLAGMILAVAMVCSIPLYTEAVLQRLLYRDMESLSETWGLYPGKYTVSMNLSSFYTREDRAPVFVTMDTFITDGGTAFDLPEEAASVHVTMSNLYAVPAVQREEKPKKRLMKLESVSDFSEKISITAGRMANALSDDGVVEVIVTEEAMQKNDLLLGEIFELYDRLEKISEPITVRVTGVFVMNESGIRWGRNPGTYSESFIMDYGQFYETFATQNTPFLSQAEWEFNYAYRSLKISEISGLLDKNAGNKEWAQLWRGSSVSFPTEKVLENFGVREKQLLLTLWVLQVPVMIMLAFYLFMMARLAIMNDRDLIALLGSRGASRWQLFRMYLGESVILGAVSLAAGPFLGLLICRLLGASNGFLEFVQRTALNAELSPRTYLYAAVAVVFSMAAMLIPALLFSRESIVEHKRRKSRKSAALWKKTGIDFILLSISGYGIYSYRLRSNILETTLFTGAEISVDPLLFAVSAIFMLGAGLLFLRIYPFLVSLVFRAGKRIWPPVPYAAFIQVSRTGGSDIFLMLFLMFALSAGIFSANAARTINTNADWRAVYPVGADISVLSVWENDAPDELDTGIINIENIGAILDNDTDDQNKQYREPPFLPFTKLDGVDSATKVLRLDAINISGGQNVTRGVSMMGIIPHEFAETATFRRDFLEYHWNGYLNMLTAAPDAVMLSRSLEKAYGIKKGDVLRIDWDGQTSLDFTVYEFFDYWPAYDPYDRTRPHLVVANLEYIFSKTPVRPYEVWMKKAGGATSAEIYESIIENELRIESIEDASKYVLESRNEPVLQGLNGMLTLGFLLSVLVSMAGFLIFWMFSIRSRTLQFGVLRAMGLSKGSVTRMLALEQLLLTGAAIIAGVSIGGIASGLFVPFFEIAMSTQQKIPPFIVVSERADYFRIYGVVTAMLAIGLAALAAAISGIKISQALKLGED